MGGGACGQGAVPSMYYIRDLCLRVHCTVTCRITPLTILFPLSPLARPPACCKDDTSGGDSDDGNVGDMKRNIDADKPFVRLSNAGAREEFVGQMFTKVFTTDETELVIRPSAVNYIYA